MASSLMLPVLKWMGEKSEWKGLNLFHCLYLLVLAMLAQGITCVFVLTIRVIVIGRIPGIYTNVVLSITVFIEGKFCQETSGHQTKTDEPHNFGAPDQQRLERVHVSSTGIHQRKRSTLHKRSSSQRQQQKSHISKPKLITHIFGLTRRPDLDVSQRCNDNVRWSSPGSMVDSCCYHLDGKHVKLFSTPSNPSPMHFYLDSGAEYHMTRNQFILQAYPDHINNMIPTRSVSGIDGSPLPVCGCGFINTSNIRLDGILYVEGSVANLVSVGQLAQQYAVRIVLERNLFSIEKIQTGEKIGQGHREGDGNLYVLDYFWPKYLFLENPARFGD